jgi:hypothetical protein
LKIYQRFIPCFLFGLLSILQARANHDADLAWGVSAMTLKPAFAESPSSHELLTNEANTISLNHFYRAGGVGLAPMPTECRISYDTNGLLAVFRCTERDLSFPPIEMRIGMRN